MPSYWAVYFGVDDADKTLARITDLGGGVVQAAEDTPYGRLATASDPTGALLKLRQTKRRRSRGSDRISVPWRAEGRAASSMQPHQQGGRG